MKLVTLYVCKLLPVQPTNAQATYRVTPINLLSNLDCGGITNEDGKYETRVDVSGRLTMGAPAPGRP